MEFKSQICTTREQSERLIKLGLKKETADMVYHYQKSYPEAMQWELKPYPPVLRSNCFNIKRLNILKQKNSDGVVMSGEEYFDFLWGKDIPAWSLHRLMEIAEANDIAFLDISKMYNTCIKIIEGRIYAGLINKDYLEDEQ